MIFYEAQSKSEAIRKAINDPVWSDKEREALSAILRYIEVMEEISATYATPEWQKNPVDLTWRKPGDVIRRDWVGGGETYTHLTTSQKFMIEYAGPGYRLGKCYPEPEQED